MGIIDVPNERSSHSNIIPKGGGIGILANFVFLGIYLDLPVYFWVVGLILSIVSLCGDKFEIRPKLRLITHFSCCTFFLMGYFISINLNLLMYLMILPLSVFIVGTLNFYNFMDGINGIAGITGVFGFSLLAVWGSNSGIESRYVVFCMVMAFSCLGFLPFNFPHAKVFMGDIGSVLLGFAFACIVIVMSNDLSSFICTSAFIFPFYIDELSTMILRIRNGEALTKPHRKHIYQLLANEYGIAHWKISVSYGLIQLLVAVCVIVIKPFGVLPLIFILSFFCFISIVFSMRVRFGLK